MARRVFFSFDFTHDVFRANQVRNANVVGVERAGYYDHSEYEEAKKKGALAIKRMILRHLSDTTVTAVLIGTRTASRPWVQYEITKSIKRGNGLLGICIHHLAAPPPGWSSAPRTMWRDSLPGAMPAIPSGIAFPMYWWDWDLERFRREIEAAGKRGERLRAGRALAQAQALRSSVPPPPPPLRVGPPAIGLPAAPPSIEEALRRYRAARLSSLLPPPSPTPYRSAIEEAIANQRLARLLGPPEPPPYLTEKRAIDQAEALYSIEALLGKRPWRR